MNDEPGADAEAEALSSSRARFTLRRKNVELLAELSCHERMRREKLSMTAWR